MIEIRFVCNLEKLTPAEKPILASGDVNAVQLKVDFCQKWDGYAKSAVFFTKDNPKPIEKVMTQDACIVPPEVLAESGIFYFGVRGVNADTGKVLTSDIVGYRVVEGAPAGVDHGPTPDVYQQILTGYGKMDANKQNKLGWVSDIDIDAMFAGTYTGEEDEDPEGNGYLPGYGEGSTETTYFGAPYSSASKRISLNPGGSVKLWLFPTVEGYDAVVTSSEESGAIQDFAAPQAEAQNWETGLLDITPTENRPHAEYLEKISRMHIEEGVTYIGDHFMHGAHNLKHLTFANSQAVTHLGAYAFAQTQISGVYDFSGLEATEAELQTNSGIVLDSPFWCCPKLEGLNFNDKVKTIKKNSFQFCLDLRFVDGLTGVTAIEQGAFHVCASLTRLDIIPGSVKLGKYAFVATPNEVAATSGPLLQATWASGSADFCFVQKTWGDQLETIQGVTGKRVAFPIPESDQQKTNQYKQWAVIPMVRGGQWFTEGQPASGSCGLFCLFHTYNILHPNAQYATLYDFIKREIEPKKITVDDDLMEALDCTNGHTLMENRPGVYATGAEVSATDLLMALDDATLTWGELGTAPWGVCKVLGWEMDEKLLDGTDGTGAEIKAMILAELEAGRPAMMEIVFATDTGHGMHIVTVIGYNEETDELRILDSTWGFPSDMVPMVYELPFEALISPDSASAIWTFNFKEATMTSIDNKLDDLIAALNKGFRVESGTVTIPDATGDLKGSTTGDEVDLTVPCTIGDSQAEATIKTFYSGTTRTDSLRLTIPCGAGATLFILEADADTRAAIEANETELYNAGSDPAGWLIGFAGQSVSAIGISGGTLRGRVSFSIPYYTGKKLMILANDEIKICQNNAGFAFNFDNIKAGTYNWTAYYWNE